MEFMQTTTTYAAPAAERKVTMTSTLDITATMATTQSERYRALYLAETLGIALAEATKRVLAEREW